MVETSRVSSSPLAGAAGRRRLDRRDVLDARRASVQRRRITTAPDLHFLALSRMHKLKSTFLRGVGEDAEFLAQYIERRSRVSGTFATCRAIPKLSWTRASESSSFHRRVTKCQRRPSVEHRGISFSVVEMSFPRGWKWTVEKAKTVTVGVCATRLDAIRQAQTFIDAVIDWAA
jgi:hypothetical protein